MSAALPPPYGAATDLPARIGGYDVRGVIGTGSMGVVYLAHDPAINRRVAIKTIQRHLLEASAQQHGAAARFRVEAQAAGRLNHRNIVSIYQFGQDADCAYIVMEYVDGHSLGDYLRRPERLTRGEVLCLMYQLLDALHYAHQAGVVHRDIKPANLIVDREGRLKITDFGIARTETSQVTRVNAVVGSPGYMAPEQYTGGALDRRVDVFAAGVLLYQMLADRLPFTGTDEAIMYQIVYGQHEQLSRHTNDARLAVFDPIVDAALAKVPEQRFATAQHFLDALKAVSTDVVLERLAGERLLPPRAVPESDSGQTTIIAPSRPAAEPSGARSTSASEASSSSFPSSVPVPTGWDESELTELERELTRYVGPVAKVLVRKAAKGVDDVAEVRLRVAAAIIDPDVRERFLTATGGSAARPGFRSSVAPSSRTFADTTPSAPATGTPLASDDVDRAGLALAKSMGPIGKVLAKRCADGAVTREVLVTRILAKLAATVDARAVEAELWRCWR